MNFTKLFETQAALDEAIYEKHPELRGQDNLDWKVLALQVELGELANEWRGFKKWSNDQEPRTFKRINCPSCEKKGFVRGKPPVDPIKGTHSIGNHWYHCEQCAGFLVVDVNPLLEEYVDVLHFALSIGLEMGVTIESVYLLEKSPKTITESFTSLMVGFGVLAMQPNHTNESYRDLFAGVIRLGLKLGFTLEQIEVAYYAKNKINHDRQANGY